MSPAKGKPREDIAKARPGDVPRERRADGTTGAARPVKSSRSTQVTPEMDRVDIASMDSFPCSDAPGYYGIHG